MIVMAVVVKVVVVVVIPGAHMIIIMGTLGIAVTFFMDFHSRLHIMCRLSQQRTTRQYLLRLLIGVMIFGEEYIQFLQFQASQQASLSITALAQYDNLTVCLSHSSDVVCTLKDVGRGGCLEVFKG
ncbi:hypothetical protein COCNU_04G007250 [Cocos nucifera]|uniref:Uncharacterized protein n=1 Tax=Cocos nucifera TaxID=13894 RepID=A0A8K0N0N3_COCNU|nr:hypothetical protein COCNU_04G007250 [Cocos nucifera]